MRILRKDYAHGAVRLVPEDADDLWTLESLLEPGDRVSASTERKIRIGDAGEKARVVKRWIKVTISVSKVEPASTGSELRVIGSVLEAPDDVPHSSSFGITVAQGTELTIEKDEWPGFLKQKLEQSSEPKHPLLIVLFDRDSAILLLLAGRTTKELVELKGDVPKKGLDQQKQSTFYEELVTQTQEYATRLGAHAIIFASPAFWQEYVKKLLPDELRKKALFTTISDVERTAVKELVNRPELAQALKGAHTAEELGFVDEIMQALAREKLIYGDADVIAALESANAKAVFVTEAKLRRLREHGAYEKAEGLLRQAEKAGAEIHILSSDEAQDKIEGLGGIVVVKRW